MNNETIIERGLSNLFTSNQRPIITTMLGYQPRLTNSDSQLISAIRIVMICALVFHHLFAIPNSGYFPRFALSDEFLTVPNFLNAFIHWSAMSAVPLLSLISGILFFYSSKSIGRKLHSRLYSIVIPSAIWGIAWLLVAFSLYTFGQERGMFEWANYHFEHPTVLNIANGAFGITQLPFAFQFWFIHDLVITLALTPLINWALHKHPHAFILALSVIWLSQKHLVIFFSSNVLFFFCLGGYLLKQGKSLSEVATPSIHIRVLIVSVFTTLLLGRIFQHLHPLLATPQYLCILRLVGSYAWLILLFATIQNCPRIKQGLLHYTKFSFIIFAAHFPVIEFVKIIAERVPGQTSALGQILSLLTIPMLTIVVCVIEAKFLRRMLPSTFSWLNGGR